MRTVCICDSCGLENYTISKSSDLMHIDNSTCPLSIMVARGHHGSRLDLSRVTERVIHRCSAFPKTARPNDVYCQCDAALHGPCPPLVEKKPSLVQVALARGGRSSGRERVGRSCIKVNLVKASFPKICFNESGTIIFSPKRH